MAQGMNKAYLIGHLGADSELKFYGGQAILKFRVATTETWKTKDGEPKERTDWHRCYLWGKRAEALAQYLRKGTAVFVEGRIEHDSYEKEGQKRYSTDIRVKEVKFLGSAKRADIPGRAEYGDDGERTAAPPPLPAQTSSSLPF